MEGVEKMKLMNVAKQKALPMALAFLLAVCFAMIIPVMRAEADGGESAFTDNSDLDQNVDQASEIQEGKYNKTDGPLITAKYPMKSVYDPETETESVVVEPGEGYFFRLDLPARTVAIVSSENLGEGGMEYTFLGYQFEPSNPEGTQYDYSEMKNTLGITGYSYEESEFAFVNPNETGVTKCFLFVPKDSVLNAFNVSYKTIASSDGYSIYLTEAGAPNLLEDKLDKALQISKGSAVDLSQAETIEVCAVTKAYRGYRYSVMDTKKIQGKLLKVNGDDENICYMALKNRVYYNAYAPDWPEEDITKRDFSFDRYDSSIWVGNVSYIFLSANAEFDQWYENTPPIDLSSRLDKDKVNVVSWDSDLRGTLDQVFKVYPDLKDKVNYINLAIASDSLDATRDEIAAGKYDGYTILTVMDAGKYKEADKFPALSEIGLTALDYSESYAYLREMGTFNGALKAVSWHTCPNGFFYNASIAKKVLGTDDPASVQEMISTPAKFNDVAKKMKAAGYSMTSGATLTPDEIEYYQENGVKGYYFTQLIELQKVYDVYTYDTGNSMWSEGWYDDLTSGKVFGAFGTNWMQGVYKGSGVPDGTFKLCEGPIPYYWGGTFLVAKDLGTQKEAALDVVKALTCDAASMAEIEKAKGDIVNNKKANQELAKTGVMADSFYAGKQDPTSIWHNAALSVGGEKAAPVSVAEAKVELSATTFTYNGKVQKPSIKSVTVNGTKLVSGTDYTVTWQNANPKNAGTYTLTINGKGAYTSSKKISFKINVKKITPAVTLSKKAFVFNGKVQKPKVTVKDGSTTLATSNYTVSFAGGCKNAGSYKITVKMKGNYSGSKTVTYTITKKANPLKVTAKSASVSLAKLNKANQSLAISKTVTIKTKGQGAMEYVKKSGSAKIKINRTSGKITVSKGLKKGTYTVKITVKAKGNANYKASKAIPLTIKIVVK